MKSENEISNHQAALNKILINHLQMIPLIQQLDFKWDSSLINFLSIQSYFNDVSNQIASFDCFFESIFN